MLPEDGKWMARDHLEEEVRQAWINGGVAAFQSLKAENQALPEDQIVLSDVSDKGTELLLGLLAQAQSGDFAIMTVGELAARIHETRHHEVDTRKTNVLPASDNGRRLLRRPARSWPRTSSVDGRGTARPPMNPRSRRVWTGRPAGGLVVEEADRSYDGPFVSSSPQHVGTYSTHGG